MGLLNRKAQEKSRGKSACEKVLFHVGPFHVNERRRDDLGDRDDRLPASPAVRVKAPDRRLQCDLNVGGMLQCEGAISLLHNCHGGFAPGHLEDTSTP